MDWDSSWIGWVAVAIVVFWTVGAYNRLVRLRAQVHSAFGILDAQLSPLVDRLAQPEASSPAGPDGPGMRLPLHHAALQLRTCLAAARVRPLDADRIAALDAAHAVFRFAWEHARPNLSTAPADLDPLPGASADPLEFLRAEQLASANFNQAVDSYNQGIGQFPASLLALLFGFRAARGLNP